MANQHRDPALLLAEQAGARAARAETPAEARDILERGARLARAMQKEPLREPGRDGHPIEQREIRTERYEDGKRETQNSPVNVNHDRIEYLFAHGAIDERQREAGNRLAKDWELAQIEPRASTVLVGAGSCEANLPADAKVAAMKRHGAACKALGYNWPIVCLVVEHNYTVEVAARMLNVNKVRAMGWLWSALHVLADHYGIPGQPQHDVVEKILHAKS
jgi:hypothetical protein